MPWKKKMEAKPSMKITGDGSRVVAAEHVYYMTAASSNRPVSISPMYMETACQYRLLPIALNYPGVAFRQLVFLW